ncbi:lysophospholipase L1-like esterase [Mucilaginibacter gracilis]|uniref:Lysophospholipase L1-like esterase n=1 Tax=Mucilaginibacter gracilis TaxID=423350 RepID=A0A495ITN2_9SPHI|nr:GDSL-type esterase/lipase family protein [Mucilaginibacter gracilis]RKR79932.1 lysophospholipase L1-like esterase [Mucilaginibacter gracilis]
MKSYKYLLFLLALFVLPCEAQNKIRVACIGNSITYGYLIPDREHNSYPAQLQALLGDRYEVMNFGSSGKTALHAGGNAYIDTKQYQDALASKADIIFIKLGTNDSRPYYRKYIDSFYTNYKALVQQFKMLASSPRVVLLYPVVNYLNPKPGDDYNMDIPNLIIPVIQQVAAEEHCEMIDLHSLLIGHPEMFKDKLHPDSAGAGMIARRLYQFLVPAKKSGAIRHQHIKSYKELVLFNGNVPKLWKRSHNVYRRNQRKAFENTI